MFAPRGWECMKSGRGKLAGLTPEFFRTLYYDQKKSLQQIADRFGVSRVAVYKWFGRNFDEDTSPLHPRRESKCTLNLGFFHEWTPEMAYVLGLIATDGCVGKNRVNLTSTDLELVEKVRSLMRTDHPIRTLPVRGVSRKIQHKLDISSAALVDALEKLGVGARKSLTICFPEMPENCLRHFLRGCWDGDGSFFIDNRTGKLKASIISGSKEFINGIVRSLSNVGLRQRMRWKYRGHLYVRDTDEIRIYTSRRGKNPAYYIKLTGQNALQFGRFIYESVPESMYLRRKYEVFRDALAQDALPRVNQRARTRRLVATADRPLIDRGL